MKRSKKNESAQVDPWADRNNDIVYAAVDGTPDRPVSVDTDEVRCTIENAANVVKDADVPADEGSRESADKQSTFAAQCDENMAGDPADKQALDAANADKYAENTSAEQPSKAHKKKRITTKKIVLTAVFTALSYGLYLLGRFCKLPFAFPSFFDLQFSELPALIAGFALGPVWGAVVIVVKCLLKMPLSSTACVGEATDILLGLALVLPATIIYYKHRTLKGAVVGMAVGSAAMTVVAVAVNRWISIPFYVQFYFDGNIEVLLTMLRPLFADITVDNLYAYYLGLSVVPFNLLRSILMCLLTVAVYKRISRLIKKWFDA